MVLRVLAKNENLWNVESLEGSNLKELLDEYKLPKDRKSLIKLLQLDLK